MLSLPLEHHQARHDPGLGFESPVRSCAIASNERRKPSPVSAKADRVSTRGYVTKTLLRIFTGVDNGDRDADYSSLSSNRRSGLH